MTAPLRWTVDDQAGQAVVAVHGVLDLRATSGLRSALLKCLSDQPEALLVDLSAMRVADDVALSVFTAMSRQAAIWPGVPMLLCAPRPGVAALLGRGRYGSLAVYPGLDEARTAVAAGSVVTASVRDEFLPIRGAARHARNLATDSCVRWGLPDLVGPVSLVVSELVSNAVEHAGTMFTLQLTPGSRYVHIAVRDGSAEAPVLTRPDPDDPVRGRGLLLVDGIAAHWGSMPSRDGKVVWATLAA